MKTCVIFCTIRHSKCFEQYANNFKKYGHKPDMIIVDEQGNTRDLISNALKGFNVEFYGAKERKEWCDKNKVDPRIVPAKTTDVIGFALLIAYPRKYDACFFIDDDTFPLEGDYITEHWKNLTTTKMKVISSSNRWVNPHPRRYPRGYPYSVRFSDETKTEGAKTGSVLNMGLWDKVPDLNAMDYLYHGSLEGVYDDKPHITPENFILAKDNYMPVARMNVGFVPKIIPAFYQLTGDEYGIGRYGDIFSCNFIQKIASHLSDNTSYGKPVCLHDKEHRDVFRDIKSEMEAIKLNEKMWLVLDKIKLTGKTYGSCYKEIAEGLEQHKAEFHLPDYITYLAGRMSYWAKTTEGLL
jgi:hypothetical protein